MPPDASALTMNEPVVRTAPALSATSDMPDAPIAAPAVSEERVPLAEPVVAGPAEDGTPSELAKPDVEVITPETPVDPDAMPDNTPEWLKSLAAKERGTARAAKAHATREANLREAAEKKATAAEANLAKALDSLDTLTKAQAAKLASDIDQTDPRPAREKFDTPEQYETALIDWSGRRAALTVKAEAERIAQDTISQSKAADEAKAIEVQNQKVVEEFSARRDKFTEEHADYADVAEAEDVRISIPMAQTIMNDPDGPAIAYYLGKNKEEAARIAALPAVTAIAELGRIAYRLSVKPAPQPKPAPIAPLRSGNEVAARKTPSEMSMEEYAAARTTQIQAERRQRMGLN